MRIRIYFEGNEDTIYHSFDCSVYPLHEALKLFCFDNCIKIEELEQKIIIEVVRCNDGI